MITKEADVEHIRPGNIVLIGAWGDCVGFKAKVHRVLRVRTDSPEDDLYEVLFSNLEHPLNKMDQIIYHKGFKMKLVF